MGKLAPGHMKLNGKVNDKVHVTNGKFKDHWRNPPAFTAKSSIAAIKDQFGRTTFLNNLGSEINTIIGGYVGRLKSEDFYRRMQSRFRKEPMNNRFLLLRQLMDMEIHERYITKDLAGYKHEITASPDKISMELKVTHDYLKEISGSNCYFFTILLITWTEEDNVVDHFKQKSSWIKVPSKPHRFIFNFSITKPISQWLLCIGQDIGKDSTEDGRIAARGMQIKEAGTFLKEDLELLEKSKTAKGKAPKKTKFPEFPDTEERVMAISDEPETPIQAEPVINPSNSRNNL